MMIIDYNLTLCCMDCTFDYFMHHMSNRMVVLLSESYFTCILIGQVKQDQCCTPLCSWGSLCSRKGIITSRMYVCSLKAWGGGLYLGCVDTRCVGYAP